MKQTFATCPQHFNCVVVRREGQKDEHRPATKGAGVDVALLRTSATTAQADAIAKTLNNATTALLSAVDQATGAVRQTKEAQEKLIDMVQSSAERTEKLAKRGTEAVKAGMAHLDALLRALHADTRNKIAMAENVALQGSREAIKHLKGAQAEFQGEQTRVMNQVAKWRQDLQREGIAALEKSQAALANSELVAQLKREVEHYAEELRTLIYTAREEMGRYT